ncbi:DUF6993 domain-containing protein [Mycetocola miduiensis]|uniref:DUF6993 domain-containing protein n=1 Tax=Mycetocola miduiensis TaxID=995034 RepID=A0A1I4ZT98_9MICO|nr:hypothetical protein [Mycetocola miduiensis]SFN53408.1 hypothetical protein SAMN05216219_1051 [Mycetocola miduiensis]
MRSTTGTAIRLFPAAVGLAVVLTGCTAPAESDPVRPGSSSSATTAPTSAPTFDPNASAEEAMAVFDTVNTVTLATDADANGRAFIDGLAEAGFDKATMELTADETTIGNAADSIQFSVRWGESCLIGQNGSAVGGYHSTLAPVLGSGRCLIGSTRPIDW